MATIYLDHNATTPVDPDVVEAMLPFLSTEFGNASSVHQFGRAAKVGLESAREQIAAFINAHPSEIYFTSGGTESDNLALLGTARRLKTRRKHIVVGSTEHHAILEPAEYLHKYEDYGLDLLPVDNDGFADPKQLADLVTEQTSFVSVMHANNETGVIQDIAALAAAAKERGAIFHTDAVQATGKIPVDVKALEVDMLSLTAHKIYGPKGIGVLFVRQGLKVEPLMHGGSHEKKRRPGTENVVGAIGLAKALEVAGTRMQRDFVNHSELADYFINKLLETVPDTHLNGPRSNRVPPTVNVSFTGIEGESVVLSLDMESVAASSGSACTSGAIEPSHVLTAMGVPGATARGSVRFSMGRSTTKDQLDHVLSLLPPIVVRLREMSPVYKK